MIIRTCVALALALSIYGCATPSTPNTAAASAGPSSCLTSTGSRIPARPDGTCTATGRSYSQTDIDQTGKTTAAEALADLDPSVTIRH